MFVNDGAPKPYRLELGPVPSAEGLAVQIQQFEWGSTALGPLPLWPAPLRIAVDMMILSPFPCAVVWGPDMTVIHNDAYTALLEREGVALGQPFNEVWARAWPQVGSWVFKAMEGQSNFVEDQPLQLTCEHTGARLSYAFSYTPLRDEYYEVAGFLHTVIETTAGVEAHDQWREQALTFERQLERYMADRDQIWQLSRDAMIVVSRDLRLLEANPAWHRALGWTDEEIRERSILELVHPADLTEVEVAVMDFVHQQGADQLETRMRHRDGHYRWFRWTASFDGSRLTAVGRDISGDRDEVIRQSEAFVRAAQRMDAVGHLAGGMAHEMNNLLSGIGGSLELLQSRLEQGRLGQIDRYVALAADSVQRAMTLTHHLLAFSRHQPLSPKPIDVNAQLTTMELLLRQVLGTEMRMKWELDVAPWTLCVDVGQLEMALVHLFSNAREACLGRGEITLHTINTRLQAPFPDESGVPAGDYVGVYVSDDGHGMPETDLPRAFEPFFTTKPIGQGAGLGLAMVYGFVGQSGGHVWLESQPGQGMRVCMLFPRSHAHVEQPPVSPIAPVTRGRGQRILLTDDEHNLRAVIKEYLEEHGFEVCDAMDASSALDCFRNQGPFDLVITDIGLPGGFSGRQAAKAMRLLAPAQKILFITGFNDQPVELLMLDTPGTALMLKPFALSALKNQALLMLADPPVSAT